MEVENKVDELSEKNKLISTKGLTVDLVGKYGAKYFSSDGLQNYLVFISTRHIYWINEKWRW